MSGMQSDPADFAKADLALYAYDDLVNTGVSGHAVRILQPKPQNKRSIVPARGQTV